MDMDVPLPEELELLEESYRIHDEEEQDYLELYPSDEEGEPAHAKSPPTADSPPSPGPLIDGHKRSRSSDGPDAASDEKRSRIGGDEEDEDWLRYSPPKATDPVVEEPGVVDAAVEEKFVWRFASEIDGDFIPVTAPSGGDRVYAKMSGEERNEGREKLNLRTESGG